MVCNELKRLLFDKLNLYFTSQFLSTMLERLFWIRRQVGSATNKTATRLNGDNLNGDNYGDIGDRVKMAKFASGNADTFSQIGDNFSRTLTLTPNHNPYCPTLSCCLVVASS